MSTTAHSTRLAAQRLRTSDDRSQALLAGITDYAIVMLDPNGCVASWNAGAQQVSGYRAEEVIGVSFAKFYPLEDVLRGKPAEVLRIVKATGRHEEEGWQLRKDGSRFRSNSILTALHKPAGALVGCSMVSRDVTAHWESEQALRVSEGRFRALVEHVQDYALIVLDPRGRVSSWNAGAEHLSGYACQEVLGQPFSLFYAAQDIAMNKPQEDLVLARMHGRYEFEGWRVRKEGAHFWTNVVITALRDPSGTLIGFSEVSRDMSERKRATDAMERWTEELQRSNIDLEQFACAAAHDLQEPLRLVARDMNLVATRFAGRLDADAQELIRGAVDETHRMQRRIDDLLTHARIESLGDNAASATAAAAARAQS